MWYDIGVTADDLKERANGDGGACWNRVSNCLTEGEVLKPFEEELLLLLFAYGTRALLLPVVVLLLRSLCRISWGLNDIDWMKGGKRLTANRALVDGLFEEIRYQLRG